ncbi:23 kDa integral membrane protein-like isoform X2 [Electrophorus electricus]|uniref:23 kDa integral membrane protein-like isoform X2 n=1 Tax=Electrophorus electricus TaxID=8005 RepID=UPI0015D0C209|nr:23 kDa integral membrane protein-like isoform X2 [Electrophorus electricus]
MFYPQIFGVILLLFGIANSVKVGPVEDGSQSVNLSVGFGLATVFISVLGVYGAYREQVVPLILYSVLTVMEFILLTVLAIIVTLTETQKEAIERDLDKMIPLSEANAESQQKLNKLQLESRCCGLKDYTDWREQIPPSCFCPPDYIDRCVAVHSFRNAEGIRNPHTATVSSRYKERYVYHMTCGPIIIEQRKKILKILLGIFFTLATITVAAVIVALMLCYKIHTQSAVAGISHDNDSRTKYELQPDRMS